MPGRRQAEDSIDASGKFHAEAKILPTVLSACMPSCKHTGLHSLLRASPRGDKMDPNESVHYVQVRLFTPFYRVFRFDKHVSTGFIVLGGLGNHF